MRVSIPVLVLLSLAVLAKWPGTVARAQFAGPPGPNGPLGPIGRGLTLGPGGPPGRGPGGQRQTLLPEFDANGDGWLNATERAEARTSIANRPGRGRGGRGGGGGPVAPGPGVKPADVRNYGTESLYDPAVLRTMFIEIAESDWEKELADFYHSDVKVQAKLTVDGKAYDDVGISFRGNSSFSSVPAGRKRSLDVSMNFVRDDQRLLGYRSLNLLNANQDPTFMRTFLYQYVARQYIMAPRVNFMRVVINGESWGIYVNTQQINADLARDDLKTTKGAHWKIAGSPGGAGGGLSYHGDDPSSYKGTYQIKSKDDPKSWADLIALCRVLNTAPPDRLEAALAPILDVDGALKFLALDKTLINNDGYWTRASDYGIYEEPSGKFHIVPWDANETWQEIEGGRGGGGGNGVRLDPFTGSTDTNKALLYRLLAVPALREKYLGYMRDITEKWLVWDKIRPIVEAEQNLIAADVKADTHKLYSTAGFTGTLTTDSFEQTQGGSFGGMSPPTLSLKSFIELRHDYLMNHEAIKGLGK